jgi:hemolysin activation/secretion protein
MAWQNPHFLAGGIAVLPTRTSSPFGRLHALEAAIAIAFVVFSGAAFAQTAPPPSPRFEIQRYIVDGNTLLPKSDIDAILAPFTGKDRDFGDIQRALEALQDVYISRGYNAVRVQVPEQDIRAGQVTLKVIEARLANLRVENNHYFDEANIQRSLPVLKVGETPNVRAIGEGAQLANDNPAKQVAVALEASDEPGKVDATIRVTEENPSRIGVWVDNTGNSSTGLFRTGISYQNANVFDRDHVLNAQYITSPSNPSDVTIYGFGYRVPVYSIQGAFDVYGGYSNVNSGTVQDLFAVSGSGDVGGVRYTQYLPRVDLYDHKLALGWDWRAYKNNVNLVGTNGTLIPDITVEPLSLTYSGRYSQVGRDISFFVAGSRNIPGEGDASQAAFDAQRLGAASQYSIWRGGLVISQSLPGDYLIRLSGNGQYTRDLLVSGEQFGMGGADSVRGFFEREVANDRGYRYSVEAYTPDCGKEVGDNWRARGLIFVDGAHGQDNNPPKGIENGLGSVGIGLRMNQGKTLAVRMDWAYVTDGGGSRPTGSNRLHFAVAYSF